MGKIIISEELPQEANNLETERLLQNVPVQLWVLSSTGISRLKSATPVKITIDDSLPLPSIHQNPLRPDVLAKIKPIIYTILLKRGT